LKPADLIKILRATAHKSLRFDDCAVVNEFADVGDDTFDFGLGFVVVFDDDGVDVKCEDASGRQLLPVKPSELLGVVLGATQYDRLLLCQF
jgi:hypothetical protein